MRTALTVLAGLLFLAGFIPYILAVLRKETKPAKAGWIIWAVVESITLAGMLASHSANGQIMASVFGTWVVAILALKYGTPGWTKLDKVCFGGAVLGIVLWQTFDSPLVGIVISLSVVTIGAFPTLASAWQDPSREDKLAWTLFWLSCVVTIVAVRTWTLADALQPIIFFTIDSVMMYILFLRRKPITQD